MVGCCFEEEGECVSSTGFVRFVSRQLRRKGVIPMRWLSEALREKMMQPRDRRARPREGKRWGDEGGGECKLPEQNRGDSGFANMKKESRELHWFDGERHLSPFS